MEWKLEAIHEHFDVFETLCTFCFPVNGMYDVKGSAPLLKPVVIDFINLIGTIYDNIISIIRTVDGYVEKTLSVAVFVRDSCYEMTKLITTVMNCIHEAFFKIVKMMRECYDAVSRIFQELFLNAHWTFKHIFLAIAIKVDAEITKVDQEVNEILNESEKPESTSIIELTQKLHDQLPTAENIFKNSNNDLAFDIGSQTKHVGFNNKTEDLLEISRNLATILNKNTLPDVQDIFEGLYKVISEDYKQMIQNYKKNLTVLKEMLGDKFDLIKYNDALGILGGDPKTHFWSLACDRAKGFRQSILIKEEIKALQKDKKLILNELSAEKSARLFWGTGVIGAGRFTTEQVLDSLREKFFIDVNRENLIINDIEPTTRIHSDTYTILVNQQETEENFFEGVVVVINVKNEK